MLRSDQAGLEESVEGSTCEVDEVADPDQQKNIRNANQLSFPIN